MAIRKRERNRTNEKELSAEELIKKLKGISDKKDKLVKQQSKLEVERDNLRDEIDDIEAEVKKEFGTTDSKKLEKLKADLLKEAETLLEEVGDL